jgi:hypothetical protein
LSVNQGSGPVEDQPEGFYHQVGGGCVIAALSKVNFLWELETIRSKDALHQYAIRGRPPVEISVMTT